MAVRKRPYIVWPTQGQRGSPGSHQLLFTETKEIFSEVNVQLWQIANRGVALGPGKGPLFTVSEGKKTKKHTVDPQPHTKRQRRQCLPPE